MLGAILAVVLVGCGESGDGPPSSAGPPTQMPLVTAEFLDEDEISYLADLDRVVKTMSQIAGSIFGPLSETFPDEDRLFEALEGAGYARFGQAVEQAEALVPPTRFAADHGRFLDFMRSARDIAHEVQAALDARDIAGVALGGVQFLLLQARSAAGYVSPTFCVHSFGPAANLPPGVVRPLCNAPDELPGGEYGRRVHAIFLDFSIEFGPRVTGVLQSMPPRDLYAFLGEIQPDVERLIGETRAAMRELTPPEDLRADHARVVRFLDEILEVAEAITAAAAAQNLNAVLTEFGRSGEVTNSAVESISDQYRPLVEPYFGFTSPDA